MGENNKQSKLTIFSRIKDNGYSTYDIQTIFPTIRPETKRCKIPANANKLQKIRPHSFPK